MNEKHIRVKNELEELESIASSLEEYFEIQQLPDKVLFEVNLVIEEIFTNIVFYGFPDKQEEYVDIYLANDETVLTIRIEDSGIPFDPIMKPTPQDLDKPIEEREIGGLGIHLVKNLMDSVEYKHADNKNILVLKKTYNPN